MPAKPEAQKRPARSQEHPSGDPRFKLIDRTLKRFQYQQDALIEVLHTAQETFGFLEDDLLIYVARQLKLPLSWVYGVATFYHFFSLKPQGEHSCIICMGTACYVKRAAEIMDLLAAEFDVEPGHTTADGDFSLLSARCLGSCGLAPVLVIDGQVLGKETPQSTLEKVRAALAKQRDAAPTDDTQAESQLAEGEGEPG